MKRRDLFLMSLGLLSTGGWTLADTGHGENGVAVTIMSVGPDALDPNKTAVGIQIDNDRRVDAILRKVETNYGNAVLHKTVKVFGNTTRSTVQFLAVNGQSSSQLRPPSRQITVDQPYSPDTYYAFGFDFGPVGIIYAEHGTQ